MAEWLCNGLQIRLHAGSIPASTSKHRARDPRDLLRATVGSLTTRANIDSWLEVADREGIDPL